MTLACGTAALAHGRRQTTEVAIAVQVLNRILDLGRPEYVRIA
jgi:hypothetical protein